MATYNDPVKCFAPLEVIERLLEIRAELGYQKVIYLDNSTDLADFLDSYGFDVYSFSTKNEKINYGDYRTTIVPGGDTVHCSMTAH
jgi:predicted dienelactone hydrolase